MQEGRGKETLKIKASCNGQCLQCEKYDSCPYEEPPETDFSEWEINVLEDAEYESVKYRGKMPKRDVDRLREKMRAEREKGPKAQKELERLKRYGPHYEAQGAIRAARKAHGISCRQLAEMIGCSRQAVNLWEAGINRMGSDKWEKVVNIFPELKDHAAGVLKKNRAYARTSSGQRRFCKRLQTERYRANMTKTAVAQTIGVSEETYKSWEYGIYPSQKNVEKLELLFPNLKEVST